MSEPIDEMTDAELDAALIAASRELIAARLSRNPARIATAQAEYDRLRAIKAERDVA